MLLGTAIRLSNHPKSEYANDVIALADHARQLARTLDNQPHKVHSDITTISTTAMPSPRLVRSCSRVVTFASCWTFRGAFLEMHCTFVSYAK